MTLSWGNTLKNDPDVLHYNDKPVAYKNIHDEVKKNRAFNQDSTPIYIKKNDYVTSGFCVAKSNSQYISDEIDNKNNSIYMVLFSNRSEKEAILINNDRVSRSNTGDYYQLKDGVCYIGRTGIEPNLLLFTLQMRNAYNECLMKYGPRVCNRPTPSVKRKRTSSGNRSSSGKRKRSSSRRGGKLKRKKRKTRRVINRVLSSKKRVR